MKVTCAMCYQTTDVPVTEEQLEVWREGMLIQKAMPELSKELRELLISGTCGPCFDVIFREKA